MINEAADAMGGQSYKGFLERMREEALLGITDEDRIALTEVLSKSIAKAPPFDINPASESISDMYGSSRVTLTGGRTLEGLVIKDEEFIKIYSRDPDKAPDIIPTSEVQSIEAVPVSQMPPGLINSNLEV